MTIGTNRFRFHFNSKFACLIFFFALLPCILFGQTPPKKPAYALDESLVRSMAQTISDSFGAPVRLVSEFIREAKSLEYREGVPAPAFIAIAILESAGFTSHLYQNAKNPFGMRATKIWNGPTFVMWHEGEDAPFRKYASTWEAVQDFASFLKQRKWFQDALECPNANVECFLKAMSADPSKKEPGYASDPEWANKVRRVIKKYGLERLR
jgi:flagellum-specific peptidoglycan hydrolase FlgJ